jgi:signal peptidase II
LAVHYIPPLSGSSFPFGGVGLFDWFDISLSLNLAVNTGVAWGLFPGHPVLLLILRLCIIGGLFIYFREKWASFFPFVLIFAGAIGNVIDLICYRYVIDFIHCQFFGWSFPIFNIADSCITIGALFLLFTPRSVLASIRGE